LDLLTVGEAFDDVVCAGLARLPRLGEELHIEALSRHPGGGAILTAIAAARLGLAVGTITAASRDNVVTLRDEGIRVVNLRRPGEPAAVSVALSTRRDRAFVTYEGVNKLLEPRLLKAVKQLRRFPRHVHFALNPRSCRRWLPVLAHVRQHGATTSWDFGWHGHLTQDPALDRLLASVDWVFVNEKEAPLYSRSRTLRESLQRWRALAPCTVIKLGPRGAIVVCNDAELRVPGRAVKVVDTTGAGDAFNAGFLAAQLAGATLADAARLANYVGGQSTRAAGGVDALPTHDRLPAWARRMVTVR
jgi:ribokinase